VEEGSFHPLSEVALEGEVLPGVHQEEAEVLAAALILPEVEDLVVEAAV